MSNHPNWIDSKKEEKSIKQARIDKAVKFLNSLSIDFISKNNNVHIYFWIEETRFDLWASTDLLWVTEGKDKRKVIKGVKNIYSEIEKELFGL